MNKLKFYGSFLFLITILLLLGLLISCRSSSNTKKQQNTEVSQSSRGDLPAKDGATGDDGKNVKTGESGSVDNNSDGGVGSEILLIPWSFNASQYRGKNGQQFTFRCPANGNADSHIYGTDVYTDDSSICKAAVHAGIISLASGGIVTIEIRKGQDAYLGSERNNIKSNDFTTFWNGSFVFVGRTSGGGS